MNYMGENGIFVNEEFTLIDDCGDEYFYVISIGEDFTRLEYWEKEKVEEKSGIGVKTKLVDSFEFPSTFTPVIGELFVKKSKKEGEK